ncbi:MAG: two pore domain potassium channel family protein [Armatimonadetes bacterium]|nr:two pore domain potassium channel family protein [Armatimonadota bacterium]MBS1701145.1 two pore domain potassium channel family protein [Armatimonadota bacterium]MBS1725124.1 two pore domain potassium channel family protein [Armatimonadota bacterium]
MALNTLWDGFETIVMTRSVSRSWRLSKLFYYFARKTYYRTAAKVKNERWRHAMLMVYAPLSVIILFVLWGGFLILGFAMINYGFALPHNNGPLGPFEAWYYSGVTFLTLGYGDIAPTGPVGRMMAVAEAATGLVFLASVITYLPVMYGVVQKREYPIVLLDTKAGSEPTGFELLRRHASAGAMSALPALLEKYEQWGAEMLEAYLSYPIIAYYRSQHDAQNWVKTATAIMDACTLIDACYQSEEDDAKVLRFQAKATFAMLRHVIVDLAYVIKMPPTDDCSHRLNEDDFEYMVAELRDLGLPIAGAYESLCDARWMYEPYCVALGRGLLMDLPLWVNRQAEPDNWEVAAWDGARHNPRGAMSTKERTK